MADPTLTPDQLTKVNLLRSYTGDTLANLTDYEVWQLIVAVNGDVDAAAAQSWRTYAAKTAKLIDVSEGSSSRKLSQLYSQALKMADSFDTVDTSNVSSVGRTRTFSITRPGQ